MIWVVIAGLVLVLIWVAWVLHKQRVVVPEVTSAILLERLAAVSEFPDCVLEVDPDVDAARLVVTTPKVRDVAKLANEFFDIEVKPYDKLNDTRRFYAGDGRFELRMKMRKGKATHEGVAVHKARKRTLAVEVERLR